MPFDHALALRVRALAVPIPGFGEQHMFGGMGFFDRGHLFAGVLGNSLVVRVGRVGYAAALAEPGARPFDYTGRPMRGLVFVDAGALEGERDLAAWLQRAWAFTATLPSRR